MDCKHCRTSIKKHNGSWIHKDKVKPKHNPEPNYTPYIVSIGLVAGIIVYLYKWYLVLG